MNRKRETAMFGPNFNVMLDFEKEMCVQYNLNVVLLGCSNSLLFSAAVTTFVFLVS